MEKSISFFADNLKFLRERLKMTQQQLAGKLSLTRSKLNALESGQTKSPSIDDLLKCSDLFKISIDTFLRVPLSELDEVKLHNLEAGNDAYLSGSRIRVLATTVSSDNEDNIEMVPLKAKAGYLAGYGDPAYLGALPSFRLPNLSSDKKHRMFQTEGDSMLPVPEGAYVIGSYLSEWRITKETPCIIVTGTEGISFKMVSFLPEKRSFLLRSLNPLYSPYEIGAEEIRELWKFEYYMTQEFPLEILTLQQIGLGISEINRKLDSIKN
ncbi:MAG TPA: LexA family transcriptional regulator [Cyclobacteriaceae bacterium]|nr:LexA family transcriptional regulator [Cyclobacteriaceae bacterium]